MKCNCNKLIFGVIIGLVLPVITSYLIYKQQYHGQYPFKEFLQGLIVLKSLGKLISISMLPSLIVFILLVTYEKLQIARGIVASTLFWVLVVLVVKFAF
ncbi:hypothetical protein LX69_02385 [Breznakibacter xylanolyticus]|uniref:Uncharacterized protein n=1 Tax=Breznakibacter xylanolyticus TaxID=990 RepID=A0A2W7N3B7_9BACT|nr:hypothetical protein [Breznakibacter xylanolyticus]MBN2744183.1 hypothetical protein [Marinilabiliaceae bacterium]PZX14558.1 hypothetical protein LX69_02385 [Breznakibacter xylanolyticus]